MSFNIKKLESLACSSLAVVITASFHIGICEVGSASQDL